MKKTWNGKKSKKKTGKKRKNGKDPNLALFFTLLIFQFHNYVAPAWTCIDANGRAKALVDPRNHCVIPPFAYEKQFILFGKILDLSDKSKMYALHYLVVKSHDY